MSGDVNKPERETQDRVIRLFCDALGYEYLGDWEERPGNSNLEEGLIRKYLNRRGYETDKINAAILKLKTVANNSGRSLYDNNEAVYKLLRFGVDVKTRPGERTKPVMLIDWEHPDENDFAVAEEVTLHGNKTRRTDVVLYINGIAIGVLELKNSRTSIGHGTRYLLTCVEEDQPARVELSASRIKLFVRPGSDEETKQKVLASWYRDQVRTTATPMIEKWESALGVSVAKLFVRTMKTRWGSCNSERRTIRLNTELAKKPVECLEYIVVEQ